MKKGEISVLVTIIISLASFFVISAAITHFLSNSDDKAVENACHSSILARAETAVRIGSADESVVSVSLRSIPPVCKTMDEKITGDRTVIKKQIADKIARCWWMFGEGRYEEILETADVSFLPFLFGTGSLENQCFVCYTIIIDQDTIESGEGGDCRLDPDNCPIEAGEFKEYLWDTPYLTSACKDKSCKLCEENDDCATQEKCFQGKCSPTMSYQQYVQSKGGPGKVGILTSSIKPDHAYAVTFLPKNRARGESSWLTFALGPVLGLADFIIDASSSSVDTPVIEQMFEEREYSSIYIADLTTAQQFCGSGDINGN